MTLYPTINRGLLLVKPKQPYDWSNALTLDLEPVHAGDVKDYNSYLLEDELFAQWTDANAYPTLSWTLFTQWFDFYRSSIVTDLTDVPLYTQEYE